MITDTDTISAIAHVGVLLLFEVTRPTGAAGINIIDYYMHVLPGVSVTDTVNSVAVVM